MPFSKDASKGRGDRLVVQVTRRATRLWIRYLLKTKNATAHDASRRTMTIAAITPPEGRWEELLVFPARADSAGTAEVIPPLTGMVSAGLWRISLDATDVVVGVDVGDGDDDDDDDSMIFDEAGSIELGTESERGNTPGTDCVAIEVEPPTTGLTVGISPMLGVCALGATAVGTGVLVVRSVVGSGGPSWS